MINEQAPAAKAPKQNGDFVRLEGIPESAGDTLIMTAVAFNYIPEHTEFNKEKKEEQVFPAIEWFFGTQVNGKTYFVKTWPMRYSIHEKAKYTKYFKALTGKIPAPGSTFKDAIGGGVTATINSVQKQRKDGSSYLSTKIVDVAPVHPKLRGEIIPVATLRPLLDKALEQKPDVPF